MTEEDIKRINELYHKSQGEGLTPEEAEEQKTLRREYIEAFKRNMRGTLDTVSVQYEDGSIVSLKEKHDKYLSEKKKQN